LSDCVQKISLEDNNDDASSSDSSSNSDDFEIEDIEALLKEGKVKNIVMVVGAGISTSAGIPDFRTPGTGLYRYDFILIYGIHNYLKKYAWLIEL